MPLNSMSAIPSKKASTASTHKKRSHAASHEGRRFIAEQAPVIPQLSPDLFLQVSTHKSLRRKGCSPDQYGDNERLIQLGEQTFDLILTWHLFRKRPMLKAKDLAIQRDLYYSSGMIQDWARHYKLKIVCSPELRSTMNSDEELRSRFFAHVGGVFQSSGLNVVRDWIDGLLSQEKLIQPDDVDKPQASGTHQIVNPPQKRIKSEVLSPPPGFFGPSPPFAPSAPPNPLSPARSDAAFLPSFLKEATKRRVTVEYLFELSEHPQRLWTANCIVNGIPKGRGQSSSKQAAKEEAAREAHKNMGWC